jgi:hypothetical protein
VGGDDGAANRFSDSTAHYEPEAGTTPETEVNGSHADGIVCFDEPHAEYDNGFAIEVQHKSRNEDIRGTTDDYAAAVFPTERLSGQLVCSAQIDQSVLLPSASRTVCIQTGGSKSRQTDY